ncbi:MAG: FAD-dependent thymidylate synthase [Candidatus Methanomethylicaceae archaeon]
MTDASGQCVLRAWKFLGPGSWWFATVYARISYSATLQQITRHRWFSFSVGSARAHDLVLNFRPDWQMAKGRGGMFSQAHAPKWAQRLANAIWFYAKSNARFASWLLRSIGIHRQHASLPVKPYATVPIYITGSKEAWENFWALRLDKTAQADIRNFAAMSLEILDNIDPEPYAPGKIVGAYLPYPLSMDAVKTIVDEKTLGDHGVALCFAVTKIGRVTTNRQELSLTPAEAVLWANRAYRLRHASVFEHHAIIYNDREFLNPLRRALNVRNLLYMDAKEISRPY